MQAEIISIGDELLIGQTINTNAAWLGEHLNAIGIRVHRSYAIADNKSDILNALDESVVRSQVVIITGGLGPTKDDITKTILCEYFNTHLVINEEALERIKGFFALRGLPMLEVNNQQAALPAACTVIQNHRGTACGMWFEKNGTIIISMPGVPFEMEDMMEREGLPRLKAFFKRPVIVHRTILTTGVGESFLADKIKDWENSLASEKISLAYLPSPGMLKLRMSAYGGGEEAVLMENIARKEKELHSIIGDVIFGYGKDSLQSVAGNLLRERKQTLAVAESCTGGYISHLITSIPGSSDYFLGGIISYADSVKHIQLGIEAELINTTGVVSQEVAEAMAHSAREKLGSDFAISTTGLAGPGGGSEKIPVGTVWIAVSSSRGVTSKLLKLGNSREFNIQMTANAALNLLRKEILS